VRFYETPKMKSEPERWSLASPDRRGQACRAFRYITDANPRGDVKLAGEGLVVTLPNRFHHCGANRLSQSAAKFFDALSLMYRVTHPSWRRQPEQKGRTGGHLGAEHARLYKAV